MRKFFTALAPPIALAAAAFPGVLHAQGAPQQRFTRDGTTYVYTVRPAGGDRRVIEGHRLPGGSAFHLVVKGDHVDGISGGQPVAFRVPATPVALAAR